MEITKSEKLREEIKKLKNLKNKFEKEKIENFEKEEIMKNQIENYQNEIKIIKNKYINIEQQAGNYYTVDQWETADLSTWSPLYNMYLALSKKESTEIGFECVQLRNENKKISEKMSDYQTTINDLGKSLAETQVNSADYMYRLD